MIQLPVPSGREKMTASPVALSVPVKRTRLCAWNPVKIGPGRFRTGCGVGVGGTAKGGCVVQFTRLSIPAALETSKTLLSSSPSKA